MSTPNSKESFTYLTLITQNCHAILNTSFSAPAPKPAWFDGLEKELGGAQMVAKTWIDTLAADITSTVPTGVVSYANDFAAFSAEIQSIASAHPDAQGADNEYVKQVRTLVSALETAVTGIIESQGDVETKLTTWGDSMQTAHDSLSSGAVNIQNLETTLTADIGNMNTAIGNLETQIKSQNDSIAKDKTEVGFGIAMIVVGVLAAPITGGASLVIAGVGGYLTADGDIGMKAMEKDIQSEFGTIATDQEKIADDQRQIVSLNTLATASNQAVTSINSSTSALSGLKTEWSGLLSELTTVKKDLDLAEKSLSILVEQAFASAAQKEWTDAAAIAQSLLNVKVDLAVKNVSMS
jgi:predicted  nucleic acid-binding Zn-ribbon protein